MKKAAPSQRVALIEMYRMSDRARTLETLLRAEPLIEFSDEHCRAMRGRLAELFCSLGTPPVGKDGSGGAVRNT